MIVEFPRTLAREFKAEGRLIFPVECYAIILGKALKDDRYKPTALYFPPNALQYSTDRQINVQNSWWEEARAVAKATKVSVLGDLHSHCYDDDWEPDKTCQPSSADLERFQFLRKYTRIKQPIFGICSLYRSKRGMECHYRFWKAVKTPDLIFIP